MGSGGHCFSQALVLGGDSHLQFGQSEVYYLPSGVAALILSLLLILISKKEAIINKQKNQNLQPVCEALLMIICSIILLQ